MDQQRHGEPINVSLEKVEEGYALTFSDNGPGLIEENLRALHYIGVTTKKERRDIYIGRFAWDWLGRFTRPWRPGKW